MFIAITLIGILALIQRAEVKMTTGGVGLHDWRVDGDHLARDFLLLEGAPQCKK